MRKFSLSTQTIEVKKVKKMAYNGRDENIDGYTLISQGGVATPSTDDIDI